MMPIYTNQQLDLETEMGINLDNAVGYSILVTREDGTSVSHTATRVGQTDRVRHVFTPTELGVIGAGKRAFNPIADFGNSNIVPGETQFLQIKVIGT